MTIEEKKNEIFNSKIEGVQKLPIRGNDLVIFWDKEESIKEIECFDYKIKN